MSFPVGFSFQDSHQRGDHGKWLFEKPFFKPGELVSQVVEADSESVWSDFNSSWVQVQELVEAMHEKRVPKGCYVIREGQVHIFMIIIIVANPKSVPLLVSKRGWFSQNIPNCYPQKFSRTERKKHIFLNPWDLFKLIPPFRDVSFKMRNKKWSEREK